MTRPWATRAIPRCGGHRGLLPDFAGSKHSAGGRSPAPSPHSISASSAKTLEGRQAEEQPVFLLGQEVVSEAPTLTAGPDHAMEEAAWADSPLLAGQSRSPGSGLPCRCLRGLSATPLSKPQTESPSGCGQAPHLPVSLAWMGTVFHHGAPTQQTPQQTPQQSDLWK